MSHNLWFIADDSHFDSRFDDFNLFISSTSLRFRRKYRSYPWIPEISKINWRTIGDAINSPSLCSYFIQLIKWNNPRPKMDNFEIKIWRFIKNRRNGTYLKKVFHFGKMYYFWDKFFCIILQPDQLLTAFYFSVYFIYFTLSFGKKSLFNTLGKKSEKSVPLWGHVVYAIFRHFQKKRYRHFCTPL